MAVPYAPALETYEALADVYDAFTADYDHELWLEQLESLARDNGLGGRRVLDVACGTGASSEPLARRGYDVWACDLSPAMARRAASRPALHCEQVFVADMAALPDVGRFDLVTCLDDAVNYLLSVSDLTAGFASVRRRLAPGGVYVFDTNTLRTYRTAFAEQYESEHGEWRFRWSGRGAVDCAPGSQAAADVDATSPRGEVHATHHQRHHTIATVTAAAHAAGLRITAVVGQTTGCRLHRGADELAHDKTVFVARRDDSPPPSEEVRA